MSCKPAGKVSPTVIADWAGLVPVLVRVKMRVVAAPSAMVAAPNVLATVGLVLVMVKHWSLPPIDAPVDVTLANKLVCAACGHVPVVPAALVSPATVAVQLIVALAMASVVKPLMILVPTLYAALAGPLQPALYVTAGVALLSCKPVGNVSPSVIGDCAGLVPVLVSVKMSVVAAPSAMPAVPNVLATVGFVLVTVKH